jgi:hypothetical protein
MLISICAPNYDPAGAVIIDADPDASELKSAERRVSRTATLDGGCVITDTGFSHADRTFTISARLDDEATEAAIRRMHQTYSLVVVSTPDGVYQGAIERVRVTKGGTITVRILVKQKLSA